MVTTRTRRSGISATASRRFLSATRRSVALAATVAVLTPVVVISLQTAASASTSITSVTVGGTQAAPTITVSGSGFGADPSALGPSSTSPCSPSDTGLDYGNNFHFSDDTQAWNAGQGPGDCIGVLFSSYSDTQFVFTLGSFYTTAGYLLGAGDAFTMQVLGASLSGQVPTIVPVSSSPVAATITPGEDAVWALSIVNPYSSPMTHVNATLHASANGSALSFVDAKMPGCVYAPGEGGNQENCTLADIPAHSSQSFTAFVPTTGLSVGTTINGDIAVVSDTTANTSGTLGTVTIVSCGSACVQAVATPGQPVASSPGPPTDANPTKQIVTLPANNPNAPPVAVTLTSLNPSPNTSTADRQLCPSSGVKCSGQISVIGGNFTKYNDRAHPIKIQIVMKWKKAVPAGHLIMSKLIGPPVQLAACFKRNGRYNTPCARPEVVTGTAQGNNLTTIDTVLFVGTDPHLGRRLSNLPDAPTLLKATAAKKSAVVSWKTPVVTNGRITGYLVTPRIGRKAQRTANFTGTTTKGTVTGLTTGKTYTFTVAAKNAHGISYQSVASNAVKVK